jgi:fatty acid-binding protein DegV
MSAFFALPELKYRRRGEKIRGLKSLVGMAMKVKPVMAVEKGEIVVRTKRFGEQRKMTFQASKVAVSRLLNRVPRERSVRGS